MKNLMILVKMQLKEKINLSFLKKKRQVIFKSIFTILKFGLVTGLCYLMLFLCRYLKLFSLVNHIPSSVISIVFAIMLFVSVISCTFGLLKTLYASHDNKVLLTLPVKSIYVFFSKLIVFYLYELIRNLSFMIPLFVAYGIISGFTLVYYPWMLFCFLFISLLPVVLGALISIPTMYVVQLFKRFRYLQYGLFTVLVAVITFTAIKAISLIPENIDFIATWGTTYWKIQDILKTYMIDFKMFYDLTNMLVGKRLGVVTILFSANTFFTLLKLICFIIIVFALNILISKPLFYKMASKPFEYYKKEITKKPKNKVQNKYLSSIKNEFLLNFRSSRTVFDNLVVLIGLPLMILLLNKMFGAMNTRALGNYLTLSFNILIVLLFILSSATFAATIYSKDGRTSYLFKVQPSRYEPLLLSKLIFNGSVAIVSLIATGIVIKVTSNIETSSAIILTLVFIFMYIGQLCWSAEMDLMNPQYEIYASVGDQESNPNESRATIMALAISFLMFGISLFLFIENINVTWFKLLLISVLFMSARVYLLLTKIKLYYKEK